jgi:hypothetical protein
MGAIYRPTGLLPGALSGISLDSRVGGLFTKFGVAQIVAQIQFQIFRSGNISSKSLILLVGAAGFEPATFWSQTRRATRLRYAPIGWQLIHLVRHRQ